VTAGSGGPVWGAASADLNATLLEWPAGQGPAEHVNEERDVLYVVLVGSAILTVDGDARELGVGEATIVEKGARRALVAGPDGVRYLTAHVRRGGLELKRFTGRPARPARPPGQ
jgi:quercetin dioxygenase-like cupin family protein